MRICRRKAFLAEETINEMKAMTKCHAWETATKCLIIIIKNTAVIKLKAVVKIKFHNRCKVLSKYLKHSKHSVNNKYYIIILSTHIDVLLWLDSVSNRMWVFFKLWIFRVIYLLQEC